ncbi:MAG: M15 family metallopeptidase [Mycobacteriales bacterium]
MSRPLLLAVAVALSTACGATAPTTGPTAGATASPSPTAAAPSSPAAAPTPPAASALPSAVARPVWVVGASPLPLRPDGFGQVLPTPKVLRDRRMTAASTLPPPPGGRFTATVAAIGPEVRTRMGESWSPACPVGLKDLRYLTVSFRGFDGAAHTGELVVNASAAGDVVEVFRSLFTQNFPIEEMRLPTTADFTAAPTGDGNNSASYVCRAARGQKTWSQHAYGLAVDINPFHNPLVKRDLVVPELAGAYADRADVRPGMHVAGGPAVRAFAAAGWSWGGDWRSSKDYMHFSANGR